MQNQQVQKLQDEFKDQGLQLVSITCDPEVDTPEALGRYARLFNADPQVWHFLTGDIELIRKVGGRRFGITVDQKVHSDRLVLLDRDGDVVGTYRSLLPDQMVKLRSKLTELLSQEGNATLGSE
jgi:cytochrome oxidase Cu insertion factor (SCO1/SenC/PrrC family)